MTATLSMRGRPVDFNNLIARNEDAIAVGTTGPALMNARGDLVGKGGQIIKARSEIAMEYHNTNRKAVRTGGIKSIADEILQPAAAVRKHRESHATPKKLDEE